MEKNWFLKNLYWKFGRGNDLTNDWPNFTFFSVDAIKCNIIQRYLFYQRVIQCQIRAPKHHLTHKNRSSSFTEKKNTQTRRNNNRELGWKLLFLRSIHLPEMFEKWGAFGWKNDRMKELELKDLWNSYIKLHASNIVAGISMWSFLWNSYPRFQVV